MSFQELIKAMTQQFVRYVNTPSDVRKLKKIRKKRQKKEQYSHWGQRWFGLIPQALSMFFKRQS